MPIEVNRPEIEALVEKRIASGAFESVEDVLIDALQMQEARESWLAVDQLLINQKNDRDLAQLTAAKEFPVNS
jgi:Arc/MetJ-type ribon-helix-helix transcriptional regulator